ncbi:MAG: hypothetical protein AAB660_02790 [Patescibacteria group bacterium]
MNKPKITFIGVLILAFLVAGSSYVSAEDNFESSLDSRRGISVLKVEDRDNSTSSEIEDIDEDINDDKGGDRSATSTEIEQGDDRKSDVAKAVANLLKIGNRNGGLGEEVRRIAREQASSTETIYEAKTKLENRGSLKTFLIGTDFKNLGVIRSEIVRTEARIEQLMREGEKLIDWDKNDIEAQITSLETNLTALETFISQNESRFSLFGWFAKLFN